MKFPFLSNRFFFRIMIDFNKPLYKPVLEDWWEIAGRTSVLIWKPFGHVCDFFKKIPNWELYFCGFSFLLIPLIIVYTLIYLAIIILELALLLIILMLMAMIFILIGIWPAFIVSFCVFFISIFRLPINMFYHFLVIYRTVILTKSLKMVNFLLIPIIHLLIPPCSFLLTLISGLACCLGYCLSGFGCLMLIIRLKLDINEVKSIDEICKMFVVCSYYSNLTYVFHN